MCSGSKTGKSSRLELRPSLTTLGLDRTYSFEVGSEIGFSETSEEISDKSLNTGIFGLELILRTRKLGLDATACRAARDANEDCDRGRRKLDCPSGSVGRRAKSSDEIVLNWSQADRPERPSLELRLRNFEFEVPGRLDDRAVDGLDSSACAS
jgi:hypothetical protein